ncbi:MAG: MATE family efflux transporter [Clostridia bacterium]|nr:MATE family efflux transporter [Clostridia bacterium]
MDTKDKFGMMTTMPVEPLIVRLAIPTMISMLVSAFYNMADTYFVGKLSTEATAAVGVVFSLQAVIQALGFYFGHGSGNFISRVLGQKKEKEASEMASTGFFSAFLVGILLMVLGLVFAEPLSELLGATPTIRADVISYMQIILVGAPFMMVSFVLNNQLRFQGSAVYAMAGIVCGAVLNIVLDPIFIFGFGMGVSGAALATILSQMVSFLLLLVGVARGSNLKLSLKNVKMNVYYQIEIFRGGFPSLIRQGLGSISTMLLNNIAGGYSDAAIAGMSVVTRISMFANSALIGFGQGFQPVVGFNYGARKFDRVRRSFWFCVKSSTGFLVALSVLGAIFAEPLIAAFRNDAKVIEIGAFTLRAYCVAFPLNSFIVMCNMLFQSTGKTVSASLMASARQGLFLIPCLLVLEGCFGLVGLELSQTVSDFLTFFLAIPLLVWYLKMLAKEETEFQTENS